MCMLVINNCLWGKSILKYVIKITPEPLFFELLYLQIRGFVAISEGAGKFIPRVFKKYLKKKKKKYLKVFLL